jgi:hypothetical protein
MPPLHNIIGGTALMVLYTSIQLWIEYPKKMIFKMRKEDGCSWEDIHAALPHRT